MRPLHVVICFTVFLCTACTNNSTTGTDADKSSDAAGIAEKKTEDQAMPDSATMAKNWQDYMTPGDVHKMMASWDGTWDSELSFWMEPGAPETKSKSTAVNKMIMNGLYHQSTHTGEMMGMPFNGISTVAYDNHKKEFISTWIDNMGSGIMVMKGTWDEATRTINFKGTSTDPGTKKDMEVRETFKLVDDNTQDLDMYVKMPDGSEFKTMHIRFTRKK